MKRYTVMVEEWKDHPDLAEKEIGTYWFLWVAKLVGWYCLADDTRVRIVEVSQ